MQELDIYIKKAQEIVGAIRKALETGRWQDIASDTPALNDAVGDPRSLYRNLQLHDSFDPEKALQRLDHTLHPRRKLSMLYRYAAVAICILLTGIGYYLYHPTPVSPDATQHAEYVSLLLGNGRQIRLDRQLSLHEAGVLITNYDSGRISYDARSFGEVPQPNRLIVPRGRQYTLQLSDGSKIYLNSESILTFPPVFDTIARVVELTGEACFEVRHTRVPFIVKTASMDIRVLGTTFNVMAYENEAAVSTTLITGRVAVSCPPVSGSEPLTAILEPGQQANFRADLHKLTVDRVNTDDVTAWLRGELAFEEADLGKIMRILARTYNIDVVFESPELENIRCYISVQKEKGYEEILKMLEMATNVHFKIEGRRITVSYK